MIQFHDEPIPYFPNICSVLSCVSVVPFSISLALGSREARMSNSPSLLARISDVTVALELNTIAIYEMRVRQVRARELVAFGKLLSSLIKTKI